MSNVGVEGRSFERITRDDLHRLGALASEDRDDFFTRLRDWAELYEDRVLCTALCQGAALHYVDGTTGVNDFDVYSFFVQHPKRPWFAKRRRVRDFGDPKFGRSVDKPNFIGRRVDLMGRGIPSAGSANPIWSVVNFLSVGSTETARQLASKAVVIVEPHEYCGQVAWFRGRGFGRFGTT